MRGKDILRMQETERRRIAEELHDTTVQDMVHLSQQLEMILYYMDNDMTQAKLEVLSARRQIKNIIGDMRETIYDLRPILFDDIGWSAAFEHLHDRLLEYNPDLNIEFDIDDIDTSDGVTAVSIYRIICECCRNILKHSKAENVAISVKNHGSYIKVCVFDDGVGFENKLANSLNRQNNHFGLQFIREKIESLLGEIEILSNSSGTVLNIQIPV
ncbi:MAG: hypothetical protein K2N73_02630 [Lachnospiraceae bacterium]|nr:hypothetical protein [Lachnospiraceae bacterium]